jgi:hypothetical protein
MDEHCTRQAVTCFACIEFLAVCLAAVSQSVDTLTAEALQDTSRWFLRNAPIKAGHNIRVNSRPSSAIPASIVAIIRPCGVVSVGAVIIARRCT